MTDDTLQSAFDAERARLIGSIYEVLLRPEHFSAFMEDWSAYLDQAARKLGALSIGEGDSAHVFADPVIEAHFHRASALFERLGRGEGNERLSTAPSEVLGRIVRGRLVEAAPRLAAMIGAEPSLEAFFDALATDAALRLRQFLRAFDQSPASGRIVVLAMGETAPGALVSVTSAYDKALDGFVLELRAMEIAWSQPLARLLSETFSLTPRECGLVAELTRGGDLPAIAARVDRSLNTLRAQLRSVFAKTGTGSQAELMRLVAVLMLHGTPDDTAAPALVDQTARVPVGAGRSMSVRSIGPEDGYPVVFVHGMLEGLGSFRALAPHLDSARLRLIAPNRQNFGDGASDPRLREAPALFAQDLERALDALGLDRVVICGHMAGSIPAFAAAAHLGARCAALVSVAGCVPILSIEQFAAMTPRQRAVAYTARFAPALLPAVVYAGVSQIDGKSPQEFARSLYPEGTPDRVLVEDPAIVAALVEGYRYTVAQGIKGFQSDAWHVTQNWSSIAARVRCPVTLIHGTEDRVVRFDSVQAFAQRHPGFRLDEVRGAGQLLLYGRPMAMAVRLARIARLALTNAEPD